MEIQYYGANCVTLTAKNARIVIDDNLSTVGAKTVRKPGDVVLQTSSVIGHENSHGAKIFIDRPGEYEVSGVFIYGIAARAHMDEEDCKTATVYKLIIDDIKVLVTGHIYPALTDRQMEEIGMIDVMVVPVGGNGYTTDGIGALKLLKTVEPKVVIPVHYSDNELSYPVPQQELSTAVKALSMEPSEAVSKLKIKSTDLGDTLKLVVLERQR
jgi:L-ascorbate metabolism protein UlaG (beta-lactamase superfamily)